MTQIEAVNQAAMHCRQMGFLTFETEKFSNEIRNIDLVDEKIEELEAYLEQTYHYESKASKRQYVEELIAVYSGRSPAAELECRKLRQALEKNRIPPKHQQAKGLLEAEHRFF